MGAYDYLAKPIEIDELVAKIEGAWEKKEDTEKRDLVEKIQRATESPRAALSFFKNRRKQES